MNQGLVLSWSHSYIEVLRNCGELFFRRGGEVPVEELFFGVLPGIGATIAAKYLGRIVRRIEADAEKVGLFVERRVSGQGVIDLSEVMAHSRAEVGEGATGIDEGKEQDLAFELRQVNDAVALIEELEVRHGVSGLGDMVLDGRFVVRTRLGGDNNIVELNIGEVAAILVGENGSRDAVAGMEFGRDDGVLELVRHGHRVHKAGNSLAIEGDVRCIGADDLAADMKCDLRGRGIRGGRSRGMTAAREENNKNESEEDVSGQGEDSLINDNGRSLVGVRVVERVKVAPSAGLMHFGFVLTGLGTALLGPILPLLTSRWHLQDAQSGLLLLAQFCGSFTGGISVSRHLRRSLLGGLAAASVGFGVFAVAQGLAVACLGLFVGGFGLGEIIASTNILAGRRYTEHRGSALALLNFSWSFGAMLSPLLVAWLLPHFSLRGMLECFAGFFLVALLAGWIESRGAAEEVGVSDVPTEGNSIRRGIFLYFAGLLLVYGGLETCLSGWLTTYALRYGDKTLAVSEYTTLLLWMALTVGRAVSSAVMLRVGEKTVQRCGLVLTVLFTVGLAAAHTAAVIAAFAVLLGLSLAPFFPSTFALLMAERPAARQAGIVLAVSGLGAAALPWLMGVVSTRTGSLQIALALPLAAAVLLLAMSLARKSEARLAG